MTNKLLSSFRDGPGDGDPATSVTLLRRVRERDQGAWDRLVRLYGPVVQRWCRKASLQESDAADVAQEVFLTVARRLDEFRREGPADSFRGWLYTITFHKVGDHLRRKERAGAPEGGTDARLRLEGMPERLPPEEADEDDSGVVHRALELIRPEFGDRAWQMFWRATAGGEATQAIADDLGVTPDAVRMAKARVLRRCREELAGLAEF
jgi:RNA polymerase sigma-70 factor, ECF subfamily